MINILITIVLIILLCGVGYWLVSIAPIIPEPFKSAASWFIIVICVIWVFAVLFGAAPLIHLPIVR